MGEQPQIRGRKLTDGQADSLSRKTCFYNSLFDKFEKIRDPVVKDDIEEVIRSLAREASVLFSDIAGNTAKRYMKAGGCRWEDEKSENPFSTCTCIQGGRSLLTSRDHKIFFRTFCQIF